MSLAAKIFVITWLSVSAAAALIVATRFNRQPLGTALWYALPIVAAAVWWPV